MKNHIRKRNRHGYGIYMIKVRISKVLYKEELIEEVLNKLRKRRKRGKIHVNFQ